MATTSRLIIEGDIVTREDVEKTSIGENIRRSRVKTSDWLAALRAQEGAVEFLPPVSVGHIIARQQKGDKSCVVVQLPPMVRSIDYSPHNRLYTLAMPYVVLTINFVGKAIDGTSSANRCGIFVYYRNAPVESLDDELSYPNLPNVYNDGALCWGGGPIPLELPLGRKVEMVVEKFFGSSFNQHELEYHWAPSTRIPEHPQKFAEWEDRSREDPAFVLRLAWRSAGMTVRQVLERGTK